MNQAPEPSNCRPDKPLLKVPPDQLEQECAPINQVAKKELSWQVRHLWQSYQNGQGERPAGTSLRIALFTRKIPILPFRIYYDPDSGLRGVPSYRE